VGVDEDARVFEHPRSWQWRFLSVVPLFALSVVIGLLVFPGPRAVDQYPSAFVGVFVVVGLSYVLAIPLGRTLSSKITVSDQGLTAGRYIGRSKEIPWLDVATVERRSHRWFRFGFMWRTAIRITNGKRGGSIVFTNAMSGFSDLMHVIDERVPAARHVRMPLIWRLIL